MQSAIAICNVALTTYLGTKSITSFQEPSPEAEGCNLHYDRVRRSLLQRWPWHFATRRELLVERTLNDRAGAWQFAYARPAHLINLLWVNHPDLARRAMSHGRSPDAPRELSADTIYTDVAEAVVEYTRDEEDVTLFPPAFSDTLSAALAAAIGMPITKDRASVQDAQNAAEGLLNQAMVLDFNTRPSMDRSDMPESLRVRGYS